MPFTYETHLHTNAASACGVARARDYVPFYQDLGYRGLFVTDHFFGGNTAVDQGLPWREQVDWFCAGYEEAKNEGDKRGFDVFFGWEQGYCGDEYLVYGLNKAWLYEHPEVKRWTRAEQFTEAHRYGACVVQAHPFRARFYIHRLILNTVCVDGAEVFNATNPIEENVLAYRYAKNLGLPMLAGSDIHSLAQTQLSGVVLSAPIRDEQDFAARVRARGPMGLVASVDELAAAALPLVRLPATVLGEDARIADTPLASLLR